jgi:hypothetical protein
MTALRRTARSQRRSAALVGLCLLSAAGAYLFSRRQQVWLTVPEALRGADVYADGFPAGRIEDPSLTYFVFWRTRKALEVRHQRYGSIRVLLVRGQSYPAVSESALIIPGPVRLSAPPLSPSPGPAATAVSR